MFNVDELRVRQLDHYCYNNALLFQIPHLFKPTTRRYMLHRFIDLIQL